VLGLAAPHQVPDLHSVAGRDELSAIRVEGHGRDPMDISAECHEQCARLSVPNTNLTRAILALVDAGGQAPTIGVPGQGLDVAVMAAERQEVPPCRDLPDLHGPVPVGRGQAGTVRAEREMADRLSMVLEESRPSSAAQFNELDRPPQGARTG